VDHDTKLNWPGAGCRGRVRTKARRALVKMWGVHCRESGLGVFLFAFRVSFWLQMGARAKTSTCGLQAWPSGASQVAFSALAPHGAGDCLPRHAPNQSLVFPLRPGGFARRIGVVDAGRLQRGPRMANAGKSRI
jgi:hypothetical protein